MNKTGAAPIHFRIDDDLVVAVVDVSQCPDCRGEGVIVGTTPEGYELLRPCHCQALAERARHFNRAGIPARYQACLLKTYIPKEHSSQEEVHAQVFTHMARFQPGGKGLLFTGPVGTGKTHLLIGILRELALNHGLSVRFIEFTHMLSEIKEGFSRGEFEAELLGPLSRVQVLGIDELGKGLSTQWQVSMLDEIISQRYNRELTTYFTSNLPLEATRPESVDPVSGRLASRRAELEAISLRERVGERIFSRLHTMCDIVAVDGPDHRRGQRS